MSSALAGKPPAPARQVLAVQSEAERGRAQARADYARGLVPVNANPGCIPAPAFAEFVAGYNAVADGLLKQRLGEDYMARIKQEVARRMQAAPGA